jgi:hypothetical protein
MNESLKSTSETFPPISTREDLFRHSLLLLNIHHRQQSLLQTPELPDKAQPQLAFLTSQLDQQLHHLINYFASLPPKSSLTYFTQLSFGSEVINQCRSYSHLDDQEKSQLANQIIAGANTVIILYPNDRSAELLTLDPIDFRPKALIAQLRQYFITILNE